MLSENYISGCPSVPQADIDNAFTGMKDYIFFEKINSNTKGYKCTACEKKYTITIPSRSYTTDELELYRAKHKDYCKCARCGKNLEVINTLIKRKPVDKAVKAVAIVIPVSFDEVWVRCEFFYKSFANFPPNYYGESYEVYHFIKGQEPEYYRCRYWYDEFVRYKTIRPEPFGMSSSGMGFIWFDFSFMGLERLNDTFFKYSSFREGYCITDVHYDFLYLSMFARYPLVTEMLMKKGFYDLVEYKKKSRDTRRICNWRATDPKKFFKLTKEELAEWYNYKYEVDVANTYIKLFRGKQDGFKLSKAYNDKIGYHYQDEFKKLTEKYKVEPVDALKYLIKQKADFYTWRDYIEAAEKCKLDLTVHNVLFPKYLKRAHDDAVSTVKAIALKKDNEKAKKRFDELEKLYGFEDGGYFIRPPFTAEEIVAEGKALHHCVGGYAGRHAAGTTTILFMRSVSEPDKPLYTIEMRGKDLRQIHGYSNRKHPKDVPEANEFFEKWLAWVKAGSKRKKNNKKKTESFNIGSELGVAV